MTRELRPLQKYAFDLTGDSYRKGHRAPILAAPCSFGKTTIASYMFQQAIKKGTRCMFTVDRVELVDQAVERFLEDGLDVGVVQADHHLTDYRKPIQVATIQTLKRRKLQNFDFMIIDECHTLHEGHKEYMRASGRKFLGLSATPYTKGLGNWFDDLIVPATTGELMQEGWLCPYECFAPSMPDLDKVRTIAGDFDKNQLANKANKPKLVGDIIQTWHKKASGRPTVVFAVNIQHSQHICEEFKKTGVRAVHVDAYTDKDTRAMINDQFKAGLIDVLSCCTIFEKGWDAPLASCLVMAAPTKSVMRYVQMVGRILRLHDSKEKAIILDHAGNTERHGWVEDIVPKQLCIGKSKEYELIKRDKNKPKPHRCEHCFMVSTTFKCEHCGHVKLITKEVKSVGGELEKKSKKSKMPAADKQVWYAMFLHYARNTGKKDGWAYYATVEKCGTFIRNKNVEPLPPTRECLNYIKYKNMRYAIGRSKSAANN